MVYLRPGQHGPGNELLDLIRAGRIVHDHARPAGEADAGEQIGGTEGNAVREGGRKQGNGSRGQPRYRGPVNEHSALRDPTHPSHDSSHRIPFIAYSRSDMIALPEVTVIEADVEHSGP